MSIPMMKQTGMQNAVVRNGQLVIEEHTALPEGQVVAVLVLDDELDESRLTNLDARDRAELDAVAARGLAELDAGQGISSDLLLRELDELDAQD